MPLYKKITEPDFEIAIWRIEEDLSFFEPLFHSHPDIQNNSRKLQWFASRHLINELRGKFSEVLKAESGKPFLQDSPHHISISHSPEFAAAMFSEKYFVGIDLEMVNPKVEKIAHKFLRADEVTAIKPGEKIEKLILYWSAKEALYKLYGHRNIEFKKQLLIEPFDLKLKGKLNAEIIATEAPVKKLKVNYEFFEDHILSYVTGR